MRKFMLTVVILIMTAVASIGCQQSGLSEEEVRSIVREEVASQLAGIDELTVSELHIKNEDGKIVAILGATTDDGSGRLDLYNANGERIVSLWSNTYGSGGLDLYSLDGQRPFSLMSCGGEAVINFYNSDGECVVILESLFGNGWVWVCNSHGEDVAYLAATTDGDGLLVIKDKYGQITFSAP